MVARLCSTKVSRAVKAARTFSYGQSRRPYVVRKEILWGLAKLKQQKSSGDGEIICQACTSLLEFKGLFDSFYHSGSILRRRKAAYKKVQNSTYYDVGKQNKFLLQLVFDSNGNYLFHRDCVCAAFGVNNQLFAWLRKSTQKQKAQPTEFIWKQDLDAHRHVDIVMPNNFEQSAEQQLDSLPENSEVECVTHPMRHGNASKKSNNAKSSEVLQMFLQFVDTYSSLQMAIRKAAMAKYFILIADSCSKQRGFSSRK